MLMDHVLTTDRLTLRPVTAHDHTALVSHWTAPDVRRYLFDGAILPADEISEIIADSQHSFATADYGFWIITETITGTIAGTITGTITEADSEPDAPGLLGTAGLRQLEDLGPEIVYSLVPAAWGKGYATEAARAVVDYALGPLGLPQVMAEIDAENAASVAVAKRLGMVSFAVVPGLLGPMTRYRRRR
jgi:[ribosomal protein S5]-alanine N-acetyltransferase